MSRVSFQIEQRDQGLTLLQEGVPGPEEVELGPLAIARALSDAAAQMPLAMPESTRGSR